MRDKSELEKLLGTGKVDHSDEIVYSLKSKKLRFLYGLAGSVVLAGANYLLEGELSILDVSILSFASYFTLNLADSLTGNEFAARDRAEALESVLEFRYNKNLWGKFKTPQQLKDIGEGRSFFDDLCSNYFGERAPNYNFDYALLYVKSDAGCNILNVDLKGAKYLDGFRDSAFQKLPTDPDLHMSLAPLILSGALRYDEKEMIPSSGFEVFTLGVTDSNQFSRNNLKFLGLYLVCRLITHFLYYIWHKFPLLLVQLDN